MPPNIYATSISNPILQLSISLYGMLRDFNNFNSVLWLTL